MRRSWPSKGCWTMDGKKTKFGVSKCDREPR